MGPLGHWLLSEWGEMVLGKAILKSRTVCKHKSSFRELIGPGEERVPWQISSVPEALLNKTARQWGGLWLRHVMPRFQKGPASNGLGAKLSKGASTAGPAWKPFGPCPEVPITGS